MAPKSIFRQPGARHFQLVHRSQRDPLINDPEASQHVLKPIIKGKSRADLERSLAPSDLEHDRKRENLGEASLYGVYYDDTDYDYMQHLRQVGINEEGVESVLIEAPSTSKQKGKSGRNKNGIDFLDLPAESLPSKAELSKEQVYSAQEAIPSEISGLQPNMNPHLRQTLEALEDDAFVDERLEDDFFGELVGDGELVDEEYLDFDFSEGGIDIEGGEDEDDRDTERGASGGEEEDESWEARFAKFKLSHEAKMREKETKSDAGSDIHSEDRDTVGNLPDIKVIGGKKRRKGTSDASGYSMSSSSMFRNKGLTLLDERFDQIEKEYESDEDEDEELSDDSDAEAPELITSREDFNAIMDDFLENYEILGGKMRHVLPGETVTDKLGTIRQSLREIGYDAHAQLEEEDDLSDSAFELAVQEKEDRWDCETILTTYSNLENHPRLIRARDTQKATKIQLDPKTGLPFVRPTVDMKPQSTEIPESDPNRSTRITVARPKNESKDEKRARKQAVKEERQARRVEKKVTKDQYTREKNHQLRMMQNTPSKGIRKL